MLAQLAAAILATLPAPSGHLYAALSTQGCTADQYSQILAALIETDLVAMDGQVVTITPKGVDYKQLVSRG